MNFAGVATYFGIPFPNLFQAPFSWFFGVIIFFFYFSLFESSKSQATLGKMIFKIVIIDTAQPRMSFKKASLRVCLFMLQGLLGFIPCLVYFHTKQNQLIHDLIFQTLVLRKKDLPVGSGNIHQIDQSGQKERCRGKKQS